MTLCKNKNPVIFMILIRGLCVFLFTTPQIYSSVKTITVSDHKEEEAAKFIKDLVNEALEIVKQDNISDEQKRQRLSEYINRFLDIDRAAQAVFAHLGYKDLSPTDQNKVKTFFKKYLLNFYTSGGKLSAMLNANLLNVPIAKARGNDFAVTTLFTKNWDSSIQIVWITDGKKIYYIEVDDINQIITLRSEIQSAVGSDTLMDYINEHSDK